MRKHLPILILLVLLPMPAFAATGVENFASQALDFLSGKLGPVVLGLGICFVAYSLVFGARDGLQRGMYVIAGGVLLFSAGSIAKFVQGAV